MSRSQQESKLTVRTDIHDMDKRIERKLRHIKKELDPENIKIIEEYFEDERIKENGRTSHV